MKNNTLKRHIFTDLTAIALIIAVAISLLAIGYNIGYNKARKNEWDNNKRVVSYIVDSGDTLWGIANEHKPEWLSANEYISSVKVLNNLDTSVLNVGDELLIYTYGHSEQYTLSGEYADNGTIITDDGNIWSYDLGDIYMLGDTAPCTVVIDDNNTPHNISDDTIVNVRVWG